MGADVDTAAGSLLRAACLFGHVAVQTRGGCHPSPGSGVDGWLGGGPDGARQLSRGCAAVLTPPASGMGPENADADGEEWDIRPDMGAISTSSSASAGDPTLRAAREQARAHLEYALHAAVLHGHVAVVRQVLSYMAWAGITPHSNDSRQQLLPALHCSCGSCGCGGGCGGERDARSARQSGAGALDGLLEVAAASGNTEMAALLIDGGWAVDGAEGDLVPLRAACRASDGAMVSLLLHRALHFADCADMVQLLLTCRPELRAQIHLDSALVAAADRADADVVRALLDAGASAATFRRGEALTRAVVVGSAAVVRLLLCRGGAARHLRGNRGAALLLLARMWRCDEVARVLLQAGVPGEFGGLEVAVACGELAGVVAPSTAVAPFYRVFTHVLRRFGLSQ
ncbi:hypothetical protein HXX76_010172 [Chlamydomonas incerta]|uniref:Uncharacterized protein n=1 Tax=Chlamydomonas incerta TaxID=51695 RepID=A0A835SMU7_CHLIN|nr:hypothetical protein HXX76_010172 [Chlamydomonas incerta]|eukprot:KAG2430072.1 hypothetical protein HXX76_010172 [Chlamydomonas incerta]